MSPDKKGKLKARSPSALPAKLKTGAGAHKDQAEKRRANRAEVRKREIEEQLEREKKGR